MSLMRLIFARVLRQSPPISVHNSQKRKRSGAKWTSNHALLSIMGAIAAAVIAGCFTVVAAFVGADTITITVDPYIQIEIHRPPMQNTTIPNTPTEIGIVSTSTQTASPTAEPSATVTPQPTTTFQPSPFPSFTPSSTPVLLPSVTPLPSLTPLPLPTLPEVPEILEATCQLVVTTDGHSGANIRQQPGTANAIVNNVPIRSVLVPLARTADSNWWHVENGWIANRVVSMLGNCDYVPEESLVVREAPRPTPQSNAEISLPNTNQPELFQNPEGDNNVPSIQIPDPPVELPASAANNINLDVNTGNNQANGNSGSVQIETGNAVANVQSSVNAENGTRVENKISVSSNTGGNQANNNNGSTTIITGDASAAVHSETTTGQ